MRIASRIPPDLRELDVDAVRDLRARRDVGERVAVLVDVDRDRRALLQRRDRLRRPPGAAARSTRRRARPAAGARRAPRSSDHHSLTSTCSGRSVTPRTARTRSTSSPSPPPSFSLRRRYVGAAFSARRAMSSGSPSQTVHEVGGPVRGSPSSLNAGTPRSFPWRSCSAASSAALAACSPGTVARRSPISSSANGSSPRSAACSSTNADRRLDRLVVPLDRAPLHRDPVTPSCVSDHVDDVGEVGRLARDDERLGELEADDPGRDVHGASLHLAVTTLAVRAPVAQGIERAPPEREVAGSNPAGRMPTVVVVGAGW